MKKINIAIDGYSSTGKSTIAKALAKKLGYAYIDSGAMYRCVTLHAMRKGLISKESMDRDGIVNSLDEIDIDFVNENGQNLSRLNGKIVEDEIRQMEVSSLVSPVSKIARVRKMLRKLQQKAAKNGGVVMDGRDIGSAVLPGAELKIFMTADSEIRANRRYDELKEKGVSVTHQEVEENLKTRDKMDTERKENPLIRVSEAKLLDNSKLSTSEQLEMAFKWAREAIESQQ
ncbi:MAG TPA: (d)CMP kinase [Cryomorphaceae bacterium]|nr:(d)CMP kinase [Cryomorphaceae bacterium]